MERTIDGRGRIKNQGLAGWRRGARVLRTGVALTVVLAALGQQAAAEAKNLVFCEKLKRNGESKGVEVRSKEQGCSAREQEIPLSTILGLVAPEGPPPNPQTLECTVREMLLATDQHIQVDCAADETVTGGGMTIAVADRLQGALFEASQPSGNGWACDAGVGTETAFTCYAICCRLTEF